MWTATIFQIDKNNTSLRFLVNFFKDDKFHSNVWFENLDENSITPAITERLAQLKRIDELDTTTLLGEIDITNLLPVIALPTQENLDKQTYSTLLAKWETAKVDVDKGLLDKADPLFAKLDAAVKAAYKPEYSGLT